MVRERLAKAHEEVDAVELARADIERHAMVEPVAVPTADDQSDLADDPLADVRDKACTLGNGDERCRHAQAVFRVVPPEKRFGAYDLAACEAELRLEGQLELAIVHRFGERALRLDLALVLGCKVVIEQAMLSAAPRLGAVHSDV